MRNIIFIISSIIMTSCTIYQDVIITKKTTSTLPFYLETVFFDKNNANDEQKKLVEQSDILTINYKKTYSKIYLGRY